MDSGGGRYQQIDEDTLTKVAEMTGGKYFHAEDAEALNEVMTDLPSSIVFAAAGHGDHRVVRARRRGPGPRRRRTGPVVEPISSIGQSGAQSTGPEPRIGVGDRPIALAVDRQVAGPVRASCEQRPTAAGTSWSPET